MANVPRDVLPRGCKRGSPPDPLVPVVYGTLRRLARRMMRLEPPGHTLQATALVHEAYLRLHKDQAAAWDSAGHFYAAAAEAMRRILIERARRYQRLKHGAGLARIALDEAEHIATEPLPDLLALDQALSRLEESDTRKAQIVKLRYFAGLTISETAEVLGLSPATVKNDWAFARAWLEREIRTCT